MIVSNTSLCDSYVKLGLNLVEGLFTNSLLENHCVDKRVGKPLASLRKDLGLDPIEPSVLEKISTAVVREDNLDSFVSVRGEPLGLDYEGDMKGYFFNLDTSSNSMLSTKMLKIE